MPALKFTVQGLQQAAAAQERIRRGLTTQSEEVKKVTLSTAELGRISTKVSRDTESAQQRLIRKLDELNAAYRNGSVTVNEYEKAQQKLHNQFTQSTGEFKKFGEQSEKSFGSAALARIGSIATGILSVQQAIRLVTDEMASQQQFVDAQGVAQTTLVQARSALNQNLLGFTGSQRADIRNQFESVAGVAVDRSITVQAGASAISATGGNVEQALGATRFATQFFQTRPNEIPLQAGAIADVMQLLGTSDPREAFGFLASVGALGRVVEPQFQAQSIPQVVARTAAFGTPASEAGALFAAFTNVGKDRTGRRSATNIPDLAKQLSGFDFGIGDAEAGLKSATDVEILGGAFGQRQVEAIATAQQDVARRRQLKALSGTGTTGLTTLGRIRLLQQNQQAAGEFIAGGSFGQIEGLVTQLLTDPNSVIAKQLTSFTSQLPTTAEGLRAAANALLAGQLVDPLLARDVQRRGLGATGGDALALSQQKFLSSDELSAVQNIRLAAGESVTSIKFGRFNQRLTEGRLGLTIEDEIEQLKNKRNFAENILGDEAQSQRFQDAIDQLVRVQEESKRVQEETRDAIKEGAGIPAGPQ